MQHFNPDFGKADLLPAVIQDHQSQIVLMVGYMNSESWVKTLETKLVTFYSRSRQALWVKGETSGNFLELVDWSVDCDRDAILIKANPRGPVCHTGSDTCFGERNVAGGGLSFIDSLEKLIRARQKLGSEESSYVARLLAREVGKIAQKVGEEAVEVVIDACNGNLSGLKEESADLLFHLLVLLTKCELSLHDVVEVLKQRHESR